MIMIQKLRKLIFKHFVNMRWYNVLLALLLYGISSWYLLYWAGETALLQWPDFIYWLVVTGSTVGYGDLSPTTPAGKYLVSFYIIPLGLSLFAMLLGRAIAWFNFHWHRGVKGLKDFESKGHILVIGWNEQHTEQLLKLLLRERNNTNDKADVVLCVMADIENPMPGQIEFVKVNSFNQDGDMDRASVADAKVIIIDNPRDDMTMTTALYCHQRNPQGHMIAYLQDESLVDLLKKHCPNIECTPSVAVEMLAKSAFDPGSSALHHDLISIEDGQAQFSAEVPPLPAALTISKIFTGLKQKYNATLIGHLPKGAARIDLNPDLSNEVNQGDRIFYISASRILSVDWQSLKD